MGIAAKAPRGGLVEDFANSPRVLILRNGEIERFEDAHRGVFDLWDGFFGKSVRPSVVEVRDLVALALVGGGASNAEADRLVADLGPDCNQWLFKVAQAALGVAFVPDAAEAGDDPADDVQDDEKKKVIAPVPGG